MLLSLILSTAYTHGFFTYSDVEKALQHPPWKPTGSAVSSIEFLHRLLKAQSVLACASDTNCAFSYSGTHRSPIITLDVVRFCCALGMEECSLEFLFYCPFYFVCTHFK